MKKVIALTLILAMAISGCAFMQVVEKQICPTLEMSKQAFQAAGFLQAFPQLAPAFAIFDLLSKGICVTIGQLNKAITDYDAAVPAVKGVGQVKPNIDALRAAVK